jgi:type IV pilus assembly protein PilF
LSLGQVANNLGKTQEAVKAWQKSITLNPRMADPYFNLATVFFNQNNLPQAKQHLDAYNGLVGPTAWGLWLGVRLERAFNNSDGEASKGLALQKLFPYSQENLEYQEWLKAGNKVSSKGNL